MPPQPNLKIEDIYLLLGEKDVLIFQLGTAFNKVSEEKAALEVEIEALKHGRLDRTNKHVDVFASPRSIEGDFGGRRDTVPGESDQPTNRVNAMESFGEPV